MLNSSYGAASHRVKEDVLLRDGSQRDCEVFKVWCKVRIWGSLVSYS